MSKIAGRTALVTGGASGIGEGIAMGLAAAGARIAVADVDLAGAERVAERVRAEFGVEAIAVSLDVRDPAQWTRAADEVEQAFGKIHIFCCNAGISGGRGKIEERSLDDLDMAWSVNARGMYVGVKELLPRIRAHGEGGHIVITASMMGLFVTPGVGIYTMSKYAATALGESLYLELKGTDINVSLLCPGVVNTQLTSNNQKFMPSQHNNASSAAIKAFLAASADPADIGRFVTKGIEENRFYLITHPEYRGLIKERFDMILDSIGDPASPDKVDDLGFYAVTYRS